MVFVTVTYNKIQQSKDDSLIASKTKFFLNYTQMYLPRHIILTIGPWNYIYSKLMRALFIHGWIDVLSGMCRANGKIVYVCTIMLNWYQKRTILFNSVWGRRSSTADNHSRADIKWFCLYYMISHESMWSIWKIDLYKRLAFIAGLYRSL